MTALQRQQAKTAMILRCESWAQEEAEKDWSFSGAAALAAAIPDEDQRRRIAAGIMFYVRTAAARTVRALDMHGHIDLKGGAL